MLLKTLLFDVGVAAVFLVMFTVIVFAHELGHYLFARWCGMGVEEFAIGVGRRLGVYARRSYALPITEGQAREWERGELRPAPLEGLAGTLEGGAGSDRDERSPEVELSSLEAGSGGPALRETTLFTFRALPIAGFVRIKGMMPSADGGETRLPGGFYSKSPLQRLLVLFAGPLFSVLTGLAILIPSFMVVGEVKPIDEPVIGALAPGMAADRAGLKVGDRVLAIDGRPISTFYELVEATRDHPDQPLRLSVERGGRTLSLTATPRVNNDRATPVMGPDLEPTGRTANQAILGVGYGTRRVRLGLAAATAAACEVPIQNVAGLVGGLMHPSALRDEVGGPETMIRATADATSSGFSNVVLLLAVLSIGIGIVNLLPIPPLDGGQMAMALAELLRGGRRLSLRAQTVVLSVGMGAVALLICCVVYIDYSNWDLKPRPSPAGSGGARTPAPARPKT